MLTYMASIEEHDPEIIEKLLDICSKNPYKLACALYWADKVLATLEK